MHQRNIQLPDAPYEVDRLSFFGSSNVPVHQRWQRWHDSWRNADRDCRWYGTCVVCGRNVWAFDDGENDPRGALGDHALWVTENGDGNPVRTCAVCANEQDAYDRALRADRLLGNYRCSPIRWRGVPE